MGKLKSYLLTGIIIVIPVFLSIYILIVVFNFLDGLLGRFLNTLLTATIGFYIPGTGFVASLALIVLTGFFAERLLKRRMALRLEAVFAGLPLIRNIYPALKQVCLFVSQQKHFGFKKVALVEYPRTGCWSIGFVTNEQFDALSRATGRELVSVYISTTPGPLSGLVFFFPKEEVLFPEMSVTEALNIIISGGVFKGDLPQKPIVSGGAS